MALQKKSALALVLAAAAAAGTAYAHQPRLVGTRPFTEVRKPEISQAFYGRLDNSPHLYRIRSDKPFKLYVNTLVPDLPNIDKDVSAEIFKDKDTPENLIRRLDGPSFAWKPFFEPFGGDHYFLGPEFEENVPAGTYWVRVTSADNAGKYALAIGKKESFPPGEILKTIALLPRLKKEFFEKSPLTAFWNLSGAFLLLVVGGTGGLAALFF